MSAVREWVRLLRPGHWVKNVFVLIPVVFGGRLDDGPALAAVGVAAAAFSLGASGLYALNDVVDRAADRRHPRKCRRPVAAGAVSVPAAVAGAAFILTAGLGLAAWAGPAVAGLLAAYLANGLAYCVWLKHRVIVDAIVIAVGFVIRLLAGCAAAGLEPSSWLVVCGFWLALVLGFGKRRLEVAAAGVTAEFRPTLSVYTAAKLDTLLATSTSICLLAYTLYTTAPDTVSRHGTTNLLYTVPLVAYGLFRYIFKTQEGRGDGPVEILVTDPVFALTGVAWVGAVFVILYYL